MSASAPEKPNPPSPPLRRVRLPGAVAVTGNGLPVSKEATGNKPPVIVIVPSLKDIPAESRWITAPTGGEQFVHQQYQFSIRKPDGTPLMRQDIQYEMLLHAFTNEEKVFTDPPREGSTPGTEKLTFGQLYIKEVINSPRCAKSHREAMTRSPDYARDYAMMCLLVNVGRCNTTLAFYPEMRTSMRSYHPVPSLQQTGQNLQDAPRMKNMLKYCYETFESASGLPTMPHELKARIRNGQVPSTNVANLLFVLNGSATNISRQHFLTNPPLGFHDLFVPINLSSKDRARAFLWLMYNYLEAGENPFAPEGWNEKHPDIAPPMTLLTRKEMKLENIDPQEELDLARQLVDSRKAFLRGHAEEEAQKKKALEARAAVSAVDIEAEDVVIPEPAKKGRKRRAPDEVLEDKTVKKVKKDNGKGKGKAKNGSGEGGDSKASTPAPGAVPSSALSTPNLARGDSDEKDRDMIEIRDSPAPELPPAPAPAASPLKAASRPRERDAVRHERTMLQQAFYIVQSHDPLYDSADEDADEYVQADMQQRLRILERILTQPPLPPLPPLAPSKYARYEDEYESAYDSAEERPPAAYASESERDGER